MKLNKIKKYSPLNWDRDKFTVPAILLFISLVSMVVYKNSEAREFLVFHGYALNNPDRKLLLPDDLKEVSGLALWEETRLAMIQDEDGILYLYDLEKEKLDREIEFDDDGDYEAIACTEDEVFIVRSDGDIYRVSDLTKDHSDSHKYETHLADKNDIEAACYDPSDNSLVIACKGDPGKGYGSDNDGIRSVWKFDLDTERLSKEPLFLMYEDSIDVLLDRKYGSHAVRKFAPSAIEINPQSKNYWVLASQGNLLIIVSPEGDLLDAVKLPNGIFKQPEGMTFGPNKELLISNEGVKSKGEILVFKQGG